MVDAVATLDDAQLARGIARWLATARNRRRGRRRGRAPVSRVFQFHDPAPRAMDGRWPDHRAPRGAHGTLPGGHVSRLQPRRTTCCAVRGGRRRCPDRGSARHRGRPVLPRRAVHRDAACGGPHRGRGAAVRPLARLASAPKDKPSCTTTSLRRSGDPRRCDTIGAIVRSVPVRDNAAELDYWDSYLRWSTDGAPVAALVDALEWCRRQEPVRTDPLDLRLCWGDVRLGNIVFGDDLRPLAMLDWDMAVVGAPEHDVAWCTALDFDDATFSGRRVDGFPDPRPHDRAVPAADRSRRCTTSSGTRRSPCSAAPRS